MDDSMGAVGYIFKYIFKKQEKYYLFSCMI